MFYPNKNRYYGAMILCFEPISGLKTRRFWQFENFSPTDAHGRKGGVTPPLPTSPIVEATGWVVDEHGFVELVAQAPQLNTQQAWQKTLTCGEI